MPHLVAIDRAVLTLSPVTIRTVIPAVWHLRMASGTCTSRASQDMSLTFVILLLLLVVYYIQGPRPTFVIQRYSANHRLWCEYLYAPKQIFYTTIYVQYAPCPSEKEVKINWQRPGASTLARTNQTLHIIPNHFQPGLPWPPSALHLAPSTSKHIHVFPHPILLIFPPHMIKPPHMINALHPPLPYTCISSPNPPYLSSPHDQTYLNLFLFRTPQITSMPILSLNSALVLSHSQRGTTHPPNHSHLCLPSHFHTSCIIFSILISHLANLSFTQATFPSKFKLALISTLLKKPGLPKSELSNFRPISNLNTIGKILERPWP